MTVKRSSLIFLMVRKNRRSLKNSSLGQVSQLHIDIEKIFERLRGDQQESRLRPAAEEPSPTSSSSPEPQLSALDAQQQPLPEH